MFKPKKLTNIHLGEIPLANLKSKRTTAKPIQAIQQFDGTQPTNDLHLTTKCQGTLRYSNFDANCSSPNKYWNLTP